jgi:Flp pilus assembly protein TadD
LIKSGKLEANANNYQGAIDDFTKAIELNPENAEAYYRRGVVRQNIGMEDEGVIDITKAKTLGYEV